ncbi:hypothetical protein D3C80_820140 [compost metagenome]
MFGDEGMVKDRRLTRGNRFIFCCKHGLGHAAHRRHVAAEARLVILAGNLGRAAAQHLDLVLRIGKTLQPLFADRIEHDHIGATHGGTAQVAQHARMIGAGVLADDENRIRLFEILKQNRPLADADRLFQRDTACFVAHVGAIGKIVGAVDPHEQLIEIGRLIAGAAGRVEFGPVGTIEALEDAADLGKGVFPGNWQISVARRVIPHGMGQATVEFQLVIAQLAQLGHGIGCEKSRRRALFRRLPGNGLHPVFAKFE